MKSPLRQQQSSRSPAILKQLIPHGSVVDSFFLFGGEVELSLADDGRFVCAHTVNYVIYEFWKCAIENARLIADIVMSRSFEAFSNKTTFHILQENWPFYKDPYVRSALFFLLNRWSTTGAVSSGDFTLTHLTPHAIMTMRGFKARNFHLVWDEDKTMEESIQNQDNKGDCLLLLMPPYAHNFFQEGIARGYEEVVVRHDHIAATLDNIDKKWIVVYPRHPQVFKLYGDYTIRMINKYGNLVDNPEECEEIIVTNFE